MKLQKKDRAYFDRDFNIAKLFRNPRQSGPCLLHLLLEAKRTNELLEKLVTANKSNEKG